MLYHAGSEGFAWFGPGHLVSLVLSFALVAILVMRYLRLPSDAQLRPSPLRQAQLLAMAGGSVAVIGAKCASYVALGLFEPLFWPLHVCNLCEFAALGYALAPRSAVGCRLADLLFCWGITGCAGALVLPGWSYYCPAASLASVCGFVEHALVLACALCIVVGGDYQPEPRRGWFVLLATVACGGLFRVANPIWGTNFFFVTNPAAVGGPFLWMLASFGDPGFLVPYLALAVASWCGLYACWRLSRGRI